MTKARKIGSFKASETLLGIETLKTRTHHKTYTGFKASETLLGIETYKFMNAVLDMSTASKPLKPF